MAKTDKEKKSNKTTMGKTKKTQNKKATNVVKKKKILTPDQMWTPSDYNIDMKMEALSFYNFKTQYSHDFKLPNVKYLVEAINREETIEEIRKYVKYYVLAERIEAGIFEYTLISQMIDTLLPQITPNCYQDKLHELCINLDTSNKDIDNQTLLPAIMGFNIDPYYLAFLRPEQVHPVRWSPVLEKIKAREAAIEDKPTSDLYTCYKCGQKKTTSTQIQLRGADEPMTIFVTCMVCYNTFTK